jgi:hypothetical protein
LIEADDTIFSADPCRSGKSAPSDAISRDFTRLDIALANLGRLPLARASIRNVDPFSDDPPRILLKSIVPNICEPEAQDPEGIYK